MDKLILDVEKIKEVYEIKTDSRYIIQYDGCMEEADDVRKVLHHKFNINAIIINKPIKIYEVTNG